MPSRKLSSDEQALWAKVIETVAPMDRKPISRGEDEASAPPSHPGSFALPPRPQRKSAPGPGRTLDDSWDRKLGRGAVIPDRTIDLHGHTLSSAYDRLDRALDEAVASDARILLLITGHAPKSDGPVKRGKIRAAIGDWLAGSRHAHHIAAVRNAHARHGGRGALYIVLRRRG